MLKLFFFELHKNFKIDAQRRYIKSQLQCLDNIPEEILQRVFTSEDVSRKIMEKQVLTLLDNLLMSFSLNISIMIYTAYHFNRQ